MLDHLGIRVVDLAQSKAFYTRALAALGYEVVIEHGDWCGFGKDGNPSFWIGGSKPSFWRDLHLVATAPIHLAFVAADRASVDAFYAAALANGATDNGAPGVRHEYHSDYYGAFVIDLDGNNLEAVCHESESLVQAKMKAKAASKTAKTKAKA